MDTSSSAPPPSVPDAWAGVQRIEGWTGESRVNTVRIAAIIAFYLNHLYHLGSWGTGEGVMRYHLMITLLSMAGAVAGFEIARMLRGRWFPGWFPYATMAWDVILVTTVALLGNGPMSPVVVLYFVILAGAPLRLSRAFVITTFVLVFSAYNFLLGHHLHFGREPRMPHDEIHVIYLAMVFTAVLAGQSVRQARRIVGGHARAVRGPEGPVT